MTGMELIAAIAQYVAPSLVALGGWYAVRGRTLRALAVEETKRKNAEEAEETKRAESVAKTQTELHEWALGIVKTAVESERGTYLGAMTRMQSEIESLRRSGDEMRREIERLRAELEERDERLSVVPDLVEDFARALSRVDPSHTPTADVIARMRKAGEALRLSPSFVNGLVIAKGDKG